MIPPKKSKKWIGIFILYSAIILISLLTTRSIFGADIWNRSIIGLLLLSFISACIPSIAGFLGKRIFFFIYTVATIVGIIYMFVVVLGNTSPGWGDLTSVIGYLFIVGIGAVLALTTEIVRSVFKKRDKQTS